MADYWKGYRCIKAEEGNADKINASLKEACTKN